MTTETEQTTTTETTTSGSETTNSGQQEQGSSTSTTENQTSVDLANEDDNGGTQTETQTEDTRTDEEKAAEAAHAELFGAPAEGEGYAVEGLPEGMEIDAEALEAVTPVARELGLSNKGLSKIAGVYAEKVLPQVMQRATGQIEQQVIAQRTEWENEAKAAIKANGHDLKNKAGETLSFDAKPEGEVLKTAARALDQLGPVGFREFLKETGLSQHPMMVAFAYQAGKTIAEEHDVDTTNTGGKARSRVDKYYGS